jgi:hypothetical protein
MSCNKDFFSCTLVPLEKKISKSLNLLHGSCLTAASAATLAVAGGSTICGVAADIGTV